MVQKQAKIYEYYVLFRGETWNVPGKVAIIESCVPGGSTSK